MSTFTHQLVIQLAQATRPRRVLLECLVRQVVVVNHHNVGVCVTTTRISVYGHKVVSAVGSLRELHGLITHLLQVLRSRHVELVGAP